VEILGHILGADSQKVRETALSENYEGHRFRVISPFLLYEAKGTNLVRIPQRTEARTREDFKQFTVMGFVVREVFRELDPVSPPTSRKSRCEIFDCPRAQGN
jgi:hypothetical protein